MKRGSRHTVKRLRGGKSLRQSSNRARGCILMIDTFGDALLQQGRRVAEQFCGGGVLGLHGLEIFLYSSLHL